MSSRSELWKHFMKVDKTSAKCNRCFKNYKTAGNTTNLWSHLEKQHNVKRSTAATVSERSVPNVPGVEDPNIDPDNDLEVRSSGQGDNAAGNAAGGGGGEAPRRQAVIPAVTPTGTALPKQLRLDESYTRAKSYEDGGAKHAEITDAVIYMICKDHMPLSTPERKGFQRFVKATVPLWSPPSRQTVTRLVEKRFGTMQELLKGVFEKQDAFCLTADVWTETHTTTSFLGVTAHYARGTELESAVLGLERLSQSHTAAYLGNRLIHMCDEWNINRDKVKLIVTDNAENIRLAVKTVFGVDQTQPCFAHTLNLIPAAALGKKMENRTEVDSVPGMPALLKKVKSIVTLSHTSVNFADQLKRAQMNRGKSEGMCLRLLQEVSTRWGSAFLMIERFLELSEIIAGIVTQFPSLTMLSGAEIATLRAVMTILRPFHKATEEMSGENYTTASRLIPIVCVLKQKMRNVPTADDLSGRFKAFCLAELDRRFQNVELVNTLAVATILDPRFKKMYFQNSVAFSNALSCVAHHVKTMARTEATEAAQTEQELQAAATQVDSDDLWGEHEVLVARSKAASTDEVSASALPVELKQYLNKPLLGSKVNPLEAWEGMKLELPHLYILARQHLCLLGTSVSAERIFSEAGLIATDLRSRLTGVHLSQLLFLGAASDELWRLSCSK